MARVVLDHLSKLYPATHNRPPFAAVREISLQVEAGEFMVLVGPSGCGKSTTLRMIAGLEEISGGTVAIDGEVVNHVLPKDRDIAMVFQNYALYPHMNVHENMAFGLKLRKVDAREIERRVREAATLLGLESLLDRRPRELSGGQRQRVAVGRAIVRQPKVFLFDEPLSNLDAQMRVTMRSEIAKLHDRLGATMIYVTHDQVEAMTMGDRICVMNEGRIEQVDAPLALYQQPRSLFTAGFIGSPPVNLFRGTLENLGSALRFVGNGQAGPPLVLDLPAERATSARPRLGKTVIIGIRPEDVHEATSPTPVHASARVELAEAMGAETYVHLSAGDTTFVARVAASRTYRRGEVIEVTFALTKVLFFDPDTKRALI